MELKELQHQLKVLGLNLPELSKPGGAYVSVNVRGKLAFVAIQFPIVNGQFLYQGRFGDTLSTEDGYAAAQLCAVNVLAQVQARIGFDKVEGMNHMDVYFQAAPGWDESPRVADGASDLFVKVLGDKGVHARAIAGVKDLPRNFSIGITCSFTLL